VKENLARKLQAAVREAIKELKLDVFIQDIFLDIPKDTRFGDFSTNAALQISKQLKKPPFEIAEGIAVSIQDNLRHSELKDYIKEIKPEGAGFINFYLSDKYFYENLTQLLLTPKKALQINIGKGRKVLVEFVSANPTGSLSVAHARQAAVGDILANILEFCAFKVKREYYLNDVGNQINILGDSVNLRMKELAGEKIEFPQEFYQGEYIYDIAKLAKERNIQQENLGEFASRYILDIIKKELDDFGVRFDCWYSQSALEKSGKVKKALEYLKKKKLLYQQEGAWWFKSTAYGDDKDRVVIKSDGAYTYLAPDIAYHREKYRRGYEWLINMWGPDHHGYVNRLKASVQALGHNKKTLSVIIVQLATIYRNGQVVQMSTRKGQYITLREVLDEVGIDAARFFFIMRRTSSHLDFDLELAKKDTPENPVFYVQYAHARICSILRNASTKADYKRMDCSLLKEKEEVLLIKKILQLSYILNICVNTQDPYMLTVYLQELAEAFHKFYDLYRVLGDDSALSSARLGLILAAKTVIREGLKLSGVSQPEEM